MPTTPCYSWGDTADSLKEAMAVIGKFGTYSGLVINWTKSSLLLLDANPDGTRKAMHEVPVSNGFKCLGIQITAEPREFISLNLTQI